MEKSRTYPNSMKVAGVLAVLVLITVIALSGTLAKYVSTASSTATARVAAFSASLENTGTIDLYDTLWEADYSARERNVVPRNGTDKIIAPGTSGEYPIELTNNSEVDVSYSITVALTSSSDSRIPVEFQYNTGSVWSQWADAEDFELTPITGNIPANTAATQHVLIRWRWAFTDTSSDSATALRDASDTALGEGVLDSDGDISSTAPRLAVENNVTFTQID